MIVTAGDRLALRGDLVIHRVSFAEELAVLERMADGDARRLAALKREHLPCIGLEHRGGVCPLGRLHDVSRVETSNTVMDAYFGAILDAFGNNGTLTPASLRAGYVAAGTNTSASTTNMTQLNAEYYRALPTDWQRPSTTRADVYFFFGETVANTFLHEFGVFAGAATSSANSGLLVCRWLADFNKNSSETLNGQYTQQRA